MSPITPVKRVATYLSFFRIILFAGVAALTGWATFTSYSAKLEKANAQSNQPPNASRVSQKRGQEDSRAKLDKSYGQLPLSFEVNRGQTDASVKYVARGPGYNIFLTSTEAVLVFQNDGNNSRQTSEEIENDDGPASSDEAGHPSNFERLQERAANQRTSKKDTTVVKMRLEGANTQPRAIESLEELPGKVNYLLGTDSSQWRTDISTYGKVAYRDVYAGVDLVYYGNQQQLEYDLVVAPGADPSLIQIKFDGAESLRTDRKGNLILKTAAGELRQGKPAIFQEVNGSRKQVDGNYVVKKGNKIGFKVSHYDRRKPLVIDPILSYLSFVNGSGQGIAMTADPAGFVYITGPILDANLNPTPGAYQIALGGLQDVFVTRLNQNGTNVLYSTYLGGGGDEYSDGIAVDASGNAYISGSTNGSFPTTPGAFQTTPRGEYDAFITKLNPTGSALVFSTLLGGNDIDEADGIRVDPGTNDVYVSGLTSSSDLSTTPGAFRNSSSGGFDAFAAKLNAGGTALIYLTYVGGGGYDYATAMTIDTAGNAYLAGQTSSLNFPVQNAFQSAHGAAPQGLFKSNDSGGNWGLSTNNLPTMHVFTIAIDSTNTNIIYAGGFGGVFKSTDGGVNWSATGAIPTFIVRQLLIDPTAPNTIYAGTGSGVYKSTDGGNTWVVRNNGLVFPNVTTEVRGLALHQSSPNTVYAATFNGIFKTTDGGSSWIAINNGLPGASTGTTNTIVIDPTAANTLYAAGFGSQRVYKTVNGGGLWTAAGTGLPAAAVNTLAINPASPATLYAGTAVGVYRTTNGGTNWSAINTGLALPRSDAGTLANPAINCIALDPLNPLNVYAAPFATFANNGSFVTLATIFKSTDGGSNWTTQTSGFNNGNLTFASIAVNPTNPAIVYTGNSGDFDGFLLKLNSAGSGAVYSTYLGGSRNDFASGIYVDDSNNVYLSGSTRSTAFPTTAGAFQTVLKGGNDLFVTKFNASGASLAYSTYLGGTEAESAVGGIAVDASANAYVAGGTFATDFPVTAGSFQTTIGNPGTRNADLFVTKLNSTGTGLIYSSYLGGNGNDTVNNFFGNRIALDSAANAYVMGVTNSTNFPAFNYVNTGITNSGTFVAKISAATASFSITGRLLTPTSTPIAGVFVEADGQSGSFGLSDSQGFYSIINLPAGNYTVTPNRFDGAGRHYIYAPPTQTFANLNADQVANFIGTQVFDIQGNISSSTVPGLPVFDVTVTLSGSASASTVTDANGNYSLNDLLPGNYTVTPTKAGFTLNPVNRTFLSLSADQFGANFTTASASLFTVSGRVADAGNTGISNVTISMFLLPLRGSRVVTAQTDGNGNYAFPNLQAGGNYTFTAVKPVLSFSPQSPSFSNLDGNQTLNFLSSQPTGLIGTLAFAKDSGDINLINPDGTGEQNLVTGGSQCSGGDGISWSPDGAKLAFSQCVGDDNENLYLVNANGTGLQKLTDAPFQDVLPRWAPDGTRLTFSYGECSSSEQIPEIFAIDAAGTNRSQLTNNSGFDAFSDWSPGGSSIAFTKALIADCSSGEDSEIYVMDPDGANQTKLTNTIPNGLSPAYSPDGFRIAYLRQTFNELTQVFSSDLYVMNSDGTGQTKITSGLELSDGSSPTWSPDGTKLAFAGRVLGPFGPGQLFIVNADGTGLTQITNSAQFLSSPAWRHFSISGHVTGIPTDVPVTIALAGTLTRITQTDKNGNYVFGNLAPGGNYSVSPVSSAFGFNPAKTDISNLSGNQIANFTVLPAVIPAPTPPLADDFGGVQRDPTKWNLGTQTQPLGAFDPAVSVVQENGRLIITPRTGVDDLHYNGYVALNSFDFNNATATVEVVQTAIGGADTIFAIGSDLDNFSRFVVRAGEGEPGRVIPTYGKRRLTDVAQLIFQVRVGGELTSLSIPYDPVQHRFMRFRHQPPNNSIAFETSPDNFTFTVRKEVVLQKSVSALTAELSAGTSSPTNPGQTIFDNFSLVTNTFQFEASSSSVNEGAGSAEIFVTRSGSGVSSPTTATVEYLSFDDSAQQRSKYILATGSLSFGAGETSKPLRVLIVDNNLVEGDRTLFIQLTDSLGAGLNSPGRTALTIVDNDSSPPTSNPLDNSNAEFFVRQHYYDFLSRVPDQSGLDFWTHEITVCGTDQGCIDYKRVNVSAAYFLSIEFQQTGYLVHRFYNASLDRANGLPRYLEFVRDTQTIGRGVVVGAPGWEAQLEANKVAYAEQFVNQPEFKSLYAATLTPAQYVDALYAHAHVVPDAAARQAAIDEFNVSAGARGRALRRVVEDPTLYARELNRAFVLAQYFGYLRRNPDDPPDNNLDGFNFWLGKLNQFNGDYIAAEMVKAFILSGEYRGRFGP